jgi:hypothetical protein
MNVHAVVINSTAPSVSDRSGTAHQPHVQPLFSCLFYFWPAASTPGLFYISRGSGRAFGVGTAWRRRHAAACRRPTPPRPTTRAESRSQQPKFTIEEIRQLDVATTPEPVEGLRTSTMVVLFTTAKCSRACARSLLACLDAHHTPLVHAKFTAGKLSTLTDSLCMAAVSWSGDATGVHRLHGQAGRCGANNVRRGLRGHGTARGR